MFRRDYEVLSIGPTAALFVRRDAAAKLIDPSLKTLPLETLLGPPSPRDH